MTKRPEKGENEYTKLAKQEARRTGRNACAILAKMLEIAKNDGDTASIRKIMKAQKYLGCRNIRKRKGK